MSMLTPSSLEKQYPNTGKNTVEISDAEIKGKEEKNTIVQYQLAEENAIQKSEQENKVKILKQALWVNTEFQESINSKVYYHGTMKDLSQWFDITKSNTAPAIFLSEDEQFADRYWINRDEELFWWRTYKATIHCKNTFNFRDKEKLQELRPLIEELVLQWYIYAPSGIKIVKYPIESFNGMRNPSIAEIVNHYMRRLENGSRRMLESPPFIEYLKEKWYDSFIITETGKDNIAVFDTSLVKLHWYKEEDGKWFENKSHSLPKISLEQIFDYWDVAKYNIFHEWKKVGFIDVGKNPESADITVWDVHIDENDRGKRIWVATYIDLVNKFQKPIISFMQTDEASRIWGSLIKRWLAEKDWDLWYRFRKLDVLIREWKASKNPVTWQIEIKI